MTGSAYAVNNLALVDILYLGAYGAPTTYGDVFSVASAGTIDHTLTFTITSPLIAGSGVSDIPLSFFSIDYTNITGLSATIYDSGNALYATFVPNGDPDHLILPADSFFATGNYTLKIGGTATGTGNPAGLYTIAAVTVPVPEPETWAMLLAGIGLVGLSVRKKIKASGQTALN
jgi:hypothetical protein